MSDPEATSQGDSIEIERPIASLVENNDGNCGTSGNQGDLNESSGNREDLLNAETAVDDAAGNVDFNMPGDDDVEDGVMIGVEIFEESDLDTDIENKLQLYSVDATVDSTDAVIAVVKPNSKHKRKDQREARLSLEERVKCIRMCSRYNNYADAQKAWRQKYGVEPPCRKTLSTLDKKFEKTGSVADLVRCGRPKTTRTEATIAKVEEAVKRDPSKSIRSLSKELGITQASVHRIKKDFEDKKNTLKTENRKLKEKLNEALKRIVLLERKVAQASSATTENNFPVGTTIQSGGVETLFITSNADSSGNTFTTQLDGHQSGSNLPTIIALNSSSSGSQISMPSVLRLQHPGQEVVHIITIPQASSSHQLLSIDDSSSVQLSVANDNVTTSQVTNFQTPIYSMAHDTFTRL
ncbi:unnamed protein product [Orchesella dallaii]|uniref:DUF4817 domain-containing protein n=1 Tax=Orchesella dallaii TaxID=48710 RepID=A0ABP1QGG3_9HEXA